MTHPLHLWMTLAEAPSLTPWGRGLLMLPDDEAMDEATEAVQTGLKAMNLPGKIVLAYPEMYPLARENRAMQETVAQAPPWSSEDLRLAFPDVASAQDAVTLMMREYRMPSHEAERLAAMLPFPGRRLSKEGQMAERLWPWMSKEASKP